MVRQLLGASGGATWPVLGGGKILSVNEQLLAKLNEMEKKQAQMSKLLGERKGKGGGKAEGRDAGWDCSCSFHNFGFRTSCKNCGKARPKGPQNAGAAPQARKKEGDRQPAHEARTAPGGESESERKTSVAKTMLASARTLPEGPEKEEHVAKWEATLKQLKETERRTLPVSQQLKSALDRVEGKRKAEKAASAALEEAQKAQEKCRKEAEEAAESLRVEELELERLQAEATKEKTQPMELDLVGHVPEEQYALLQVQMSQVLDLLKKVAEVVPAEAPVKEQLTSLLATTATSLQPPTLATPVSPDKEPQQEVVMTGGGGFGKVTATPPPRETVAPYKGGKGTGGGDADL